MKKLIILLALAALFISCEKEDPCDCYYSDVFQQYLPDRKMEQVLIKYPTSYERMRALHADCKRKGC